MSVSFTNFDAIFKPKSVAVIGATMREGSLGRTIMSNLVGYEFNGKVFPVNPSKPVVHSIKCFPTIEHIPDEVDLAVIIIPKEYVLEATEQCGRKGVKGLVTLTAGFREVGGPGIKLEEELVAICRKYGMRMIGPNCMGVVNTDPVYKMNATFAPEFPAAGNIGFISQSGALGVAIISQAKRYNIGLSMFASVGNKADISGNDLIEYWEDDPRTDVILLYLESFGNPRNFTRIAKRVSRKKPIIAVKAGRSVAGAKAASSHTGAIAGMDVAADAILEQCGIIRVTSIQEMFELAVAFSRKKYPKGKKVAIVTNGGGPAIMAADACSSVGLEVPVFSPSTKAQLKKLLPPEAAISNPVDMIASGGPDDYENVLNVISEDDDIDAIMVISVTPPTLVEPRAVIRKIAQVFKTTDKPLLTVVMGKDVMQRTDIADKVPDIPAYQFPEPPALAIAEMLRYNKWRTKPEGKIKKFAVDKKSVQKILDKKEAVKPQYLSDEEVYGILSAYGLNIVDSTVAKTHEEAADVADRLGFPVVLKGKAQGLIHKSDVGGVAVDLRNRGEVIEAYYDIRKKINRHKKDSFQAVRVQKMIQSGKEVILGMTSISQFGPLLMFGLGGIYVEIIKDVHFRTAPITDLEAEEMISSIKGYQILKGVRGEKGVDLNSIKDTLLRVSQLVTDFECIQAIDINPFMVGDRKENSHIVDARILAGRVR
ncbi:acetate--CoA ligase family protein [candidate division KSB1 bacterium]